jgi:molybdenum cofactor guanylyltransferase
MHPRSCTGVVLAGGANSRFGGTLKGFLPLGNDRIVDRVLAAISDAADDVIIIANDDEVARALPDLAVHADVSADRGSLVGLFTAVSRVQEAALVTAWDMPFLSTALLRELRRLGEAHDAAVIPEGPQGVEPLCAYYPRSSSAVMQRQLAAGELRLGALVNALPARVILPLADVARFGAPEQLFANVNTATDLAAAARWLEEPAGASEHRRSSHSENPR